MEILGLSECVSAIQDELNAKARQAEAGVKLAGQAYASDVKALAPYKTGTYRRSIHVEPGVRSDDQGNPIALIGTDLPYARRLEFGFFDMTDRLGRHYKQPAQPHFRPPLDTEMPKYLRIMEGAFDKDEWIRDIGVLAGVRADLHNFTLPSLSGTIGQAMGGSKLELIQGSMLGDFGGYE